MAKIVYAKKGKTSELWELCRNSDLERDIGDLCRPLRRIVSP